MYAQGNILLLADVFENFRNMCLEIFGLDCPKCFLAPGLAWQTFLKKTKVKLQLLSDIDMLMMVGKGIRGGICHSFYQYAKTNNKYMKDYAKSKDFSYLQYWDVNNLYGLVMSQKLPGNNFEWIKDASQFNEDLVKNYHKEKHKGYFLKVDVHYTEKLNELHNNPFTLRAHWCLTSLNACNP